MHPLELLFEFKFWDICAEFEDFLRFENKMVQTVKKIIMVFQVSVFFLKTLHFLDYLVLEEFFENHIMLYICYRSNPK